MKKLRFALLLVLTIVLACGVFGGCKNSNRPKANSYVEFWGWGDPEEVAVFKELTANFNKIHEGDIYVEYKQKPSESYASSTAQALSGRNGPDVVYVGDGNIKQWAALNLLEPLDVYLNKSTEIDPDDIWDSALQRYRVDINTMQSRPTDPIYAVPKDIGPSVIYYNADAIKEVGVTIISVDADKISEFNAANSTSYTARGYDATAKVFNNRIAMTWEESLSLFKLLTKSYNSNSPTEYGYFTEWWFNYGWSVGGDCIKFDGTNWKFSLGSTEVLKNDKGEDMPSMRDAFTHFVQLSQPKSVDVDGKGNMGYAVTPSPNTLGTQGKVGYFTSEQVAMLVDGRFSTVPIRKNAKFDWDVAPLPKAEKGIEAGHSGSMGMGINKKSKVKDSAWLFCEFIAGKTGQTAQAKTGFNIPNQKSLANTDLFLQQDQKPKNSSIFLAAAEIQKPGDWWYLSDSLWIDQWAPLLNGDVRNGKTNVTQFFDIVTERTNTALKKYIK